MINTIIEGDCTEKLKLLSDNSVDIVFTSPPYNVGGTTRTGKNTKKLYEEYGDNLTDDDYYKLLSRCLEESLRVCKGGVFFNINYMSNNKLTLFKWVSDYAKYLKETIIWNKETHQPPIGNILAKRYEFIFLFTKNKDFEVNNHKVNKAEKYRKQFGAWISNLVTVKPGEQEYNSVHRAAFPKSLPYIFIDIYSKTNDVVLDPFCGTGTTCVAAKELKRNYIGIELAKKYIDISKERLRQESLDLF